MIEFTDEETKEVLATLKESLQFFISRDEMNAAVHLAGIRYSPITERVADTWDIVNKKVHSG